MEPKDIIKIILSSGTIGTILGISVTHLLYNSKLKKEQRVKILGENSKRRINCVTDILKVVNELKEYERIDIVHPESNINKPLTYPSIFENYTKYEKFSKKYKELVEKYADLLNQKCLMDLYLGMNYINSLRIVAYMIFTEKDLHILGTYLHPEIDNWVMKFKDDLNKLLNNPLLKYEKRTGLKYKLKLKLIIYKVKHSLLYKQFLKNTELEDDKIGNIFAKQSKKRKVHKEIIQDINKGLGEKIR